MTRVFNTNFHRSLLNSEVFFFLESIRSNQLHQVVVGIKITILSINRANISNSRTILWNLNMPWVEVYIHFVWSTKNRYPFLANKELRKRVWKHIKENGEKKGIKIHFVNGYSDHCHCLVTLKTNQNLKDIMHLIKGESSWWINKNNLTTKKFEWQDEYYSGSISKSLVEKVRNYIKGQEKRHGTSL